MPDVKQLQIGENVYDIHDVTARTSLAGKQNTISDLSTIRTNASNAKTKSDTAIARLNVFKIEIPLFYAKQSYTIPAASAAGYLGAQTAVDCDGTNYYLSYVNDVAMASAQNINLKFSWLGTLGWQGSIHCMVTRMTHSSTENATTTLFMRNLTTTARTENNSTTWTREAFIFYSNS